MINNIFFDMDMTLLNFHKAEERALQQTLEKAGIAPTKERISGYSRINISQWKLLEQGKLTRERLRIQRFEIFIEEYRLGADAKVLAESYEGNLAHGFDRMDGALEVLGRLKGEYRLFITSNGTARIQHARAEGSGIAPYFEHVFISQEIGYPKPDIRYFDACFAQIATSGKGPIRREETVIVGDSLSSDIAGGIRAGIHTIWLCSQADIEQLQMRTLEIVPEICITHLDQLPEAVRQLR